MSDKNQSANETLLRRLADFIAEGHALGAEDERLNDEIKAAGIDPAAFAAKAQAMLDEAVKERRAAIHARRVGITARLDALLEGWKDRARRWTAEDEAAWAAKLEPRLAGAYFRNFKSASSADKASMLEDLELLEKLDELAREEEKKR